MLFNKLLWGSTYRNVTWTSNVNNHTFFFSTCSFYTLCMLCFTHFSNMLEFSHDLFFQDSFIFTSRACDSQVNNCFFTLSHIVYMLLSVYFNALSGHKVEIHFHIFQIWLHIIHIITHGNKQTTKKKKYCECDISIRDFKPGTVTGSDMCMSLAYIYCHLLWLQQLTSLIIS